MPGPRGAGPRTRARRRAVAAAVALFCLVAVVAVVIGWHLAGLGDRRLEVGQSAPAFRGVTLEGETVSLEALRDQVVLLDFWATWCAPCLAEMPTLQELHRTFGPRGLAVVGVNIEPTTARVAVADIVHEAALQYPVLVAGGAVGEQYGARGLPHLVLIDRNGVVLRVFEGAVPREELMRAVHRALEEPAAR